MGTGTGAIMGTVAALQAERARLREESAALREEIGLYMRAVIDRTLSATQREKALSDLIGAQAHQAAVDARLAAIKDELAQAASVDKRAARERASATLAAFKSAFEGEDEDAVAEAAIAAHRAARELRALAGIRVSAPRSGGSSGAAQLWGTPSGLLVIPMGAEAAQEAREALPTLAGAPSQTFAWGGRPSVKFFLGEDDARDVLAELGHVGELTRPLATIKDRVQRYLDGEKPAKIVKL